jgi:hypothetical protein
MFHADMQRLLISHAIVFKTCDVCNRPGIKPVGNIHIPDKYRILIKRRVNYVQNDSWKTRFKVKLC